MKRILSIGTVLAAVLAIALAGSASATDTNQTDYWEGQYDATCVKYEPGDQSAPVDFWFSDGVVLSPGEYVALILKSALVNDVFEDPTPGNLYMTRSGKDISHIIVCTPKEVEPSPTPEPTPTPSPTPSPTPTPTPTPSPSPSSSPEPSSTPTPAPSATPSVPADTPTPTAPTLTAPPTDTVPAAGASATTGSLAFPLLVALFLIATMPLLAKAPARR